MALAFGEFYGLVTRRNVVLGSAFVAFMRSVEHASALSKAEKEMVMLLSAEKRGCVYCVSAHTKLAAGAGVNAQAALDARAKKIADGLAAADRERLLGFIEGSRKMILSEPRALLTEASRLPGIDGQKMSKSYVFA